MNEHDLLKAGIRINRGYWYFACLWGITVVWVLVEGGRSGKLDNVSHLLIIITLVSWVISKGLTPLLHARLASKLTLPEVRLLIRTFGRSRPRAELLAHMYLLTFGLKSVQNRHDLSEPEWKIIAFATRSDLRELAETARKQLQKHQIVEAVTWLDRAELRNRLILDKLAFTVTALEELRRGKFTARNRFATPVPAPWRTVDFIRGAKAERQQWLEIGFFSGAVIGLVFFLTSGAEQRFGLIFLPLITIPILGSFFSFDNNVVPPEDFEPGVISDLLDRHDDARSWGARGITRQALRRALLAISDYSDLKEKDWERLLLLLREKPGNDRVALLEALAQHIPLTLIPLVESEKARWLGSPKRFAPFRIQELTNIRLTMHRRLGAPRDPASFEEGHPSE